MLALGLLLLWQSMLAGFGSILRLTGRTDVTKYVYFPPPGLLDEVIAKKRI